MYIVSMPNCMHLGTKNGMYLEDPEIRAFVKENTGHLESINVNTESLFTPDCSINNHPRFGTIARCIRERRGEKVNIQVPLFQDQNTDMMAISDTDPYPGKIYMDAMPFGMGQCCL